MNRISKTFLSLGLATTFLLGSVGGTAQAYTETKGNLKHSCKKNGTLSKSQVKKGAKDLENGASIGTWGAFIANLSPGGFVYDISMIAGGNIKDRWIKAAAAGKSATVDHCEATNAGVNNGQGTLAYDKVKFK